MNSWQIISIIMLLGIVAIMGGGGWWLLRYSRQRKQIIEERLLAMKRAAAEKAAAEKAAAEKAAAHSAAIARAAAERLAAKRAAIEKAVAEKAASEKAAVEQAIAEWAAAEQAEAERARQQRASENRQEAEASQERLQAIEEAIAEWVEAEREGKQLAATKSGPSSYSNRTTTPTEAVHQQVRSTAQNVEKEVHDLEFIKNRIEADVDFLPIEFQQTIDDWKAGKILRRNTFEDLKLKFRYKAYSIEDGYEMLYLYNEWLSQQRQKLRVFIHLLGTEVDNSESIQAAIEQAEHKEREKYLEMDVDVIFTLRDIRAILEKLIGMENILKDLEGVCRKRSEQIISPPWEARGSL
ncbi:MAG: hypothetical protein KDJ31_08830 [Candidatus Competibacteraceae bacterium]|nr:hypothetical protein [Candidatus Competibacteraceae bacterium]HRY14411.1 hypothetical protein [Candidatus Competibacteraceae bacterium]